MKKLVVLFVLLPTAVFAQNASSDVAFSAKAIAVLQQQRNQAFDAAAGLEVRLGIAQEELATAQAKIKELEAKVTPEKKQDEK